MDSQAPENLIGKVSFISSQNVYVKFKSTSGISAGDTLFITSGDKLLPALVVNNLSSSSCVCRSLNDENIPLDHIVIARVRIEKSKPQQAKPEILNIQYQKINHRQILLISRTRRERTNKSFREVFLKIPILIFQILALQIHSALGIHYHFCRKYSRLKVLDRILCLIQT